MGLDVGLFVYNAGADSLNTYFLDVAAEEWHGMLRRNCTVPLLASHHYGLAMVERQRGGILLVTSGAAWAGGGRLTTYGGTKAFDLVFAEGLWAELRRDGVDVLSLVVGATDTPALRASLEKFGVTVDDLAEMSPLADTADVARPGAHPPRRRSDLAGGSAATVPDRRCWPGCRGGRRSSSSPRVTTCCSATDAPRRLRSAHELPGVRLRHRSTAALTDRG